MLLVPHGSRPSRIQTSYSTTSAEGVIVTASATAHTKGAWSEVIASTSFDAIGVWIGLNDTGVASAANRALVDIGIGGAGAETVWIPDLDAGNAALWSAGYWGQVYYFPLYLPVGTRISARCQASTVSDTVGVAVVLLGGSRVPGCWVGTRVTAYGVDSATSSGSVAMTFGSTNAWGSAAQITASTTNPIRAFQYAIDNGADSTATNQRSLLRFGIGAGPTWFAEGIPHGENSSIETQHNMPGNFVLSQMHFNIPAGSDLRVAGMVNGTGEARRIIVYGVD